MKKLLTATAFVLSFGAASFAQQKAPFQTKPAKVEAVKKTPAVATKSIAKKDGTPDKRYKANKKAGTAKSKKTA
jgi:hypothetical protein